MTFVVACKFVTLDIFMCYSNTFNQTPNASTLNEVVNQEDLKINWFGEYTITDKRHILHIDIK